MQPAHQSPRRKYLQIIVILLPILLIIMRTRSLSLWYYLALLPLLIVLLAVQFYDRGMRGVGRVVLIAGMCVASVATVLVVLLLSALWSWWVFGVLATAVVCGALWLERCLRVSYPTFFTGQYEQNYGTAPVQKR
jgi:hypothetical protein